MKKTSRLLLVSVLLVSFSITTFAIYDPDSKPQERNSEVSITTLSKTLQSETKFTDVQHHPAIDDIAYVEREGLMAGYPDKTFRPDREVNRLEFVVLLDRVFDFNFSAVTFIKQPEVKDMFDDVYDGKWYSYPLLETTFFGLLNTEDRMFKPDKLVTRIEVAQSIKQSFKAKNLGVMMTQIYPLFSDTTDLSPEESAAINFVFNTGIMKGNNDNTFKPYQHITRAELAGVLQRLMDTVKVAEPVDPVLSQEDEMDMNRNVEVRK